MTALETTPDERAALEALHANVHRYFQLKPNDDASYKFGDACLEMCPRLLHDIASLLTENERLEAERDEAYVDSRSKHDRLTRVVEGSKAIREERDSALAVIKRLADALPPEVAEVWARDLSGHARWSVEKYATLLSEWQAAHLQTPGEAGE